MTLWNRRQPKGQPTGGQYAARHRDEDELVLIGEIGADLLEAGDRRTPSARLSDLANSQYRSIRETVAANPRAFEETIRLLSFDDDPTVRAAILRNTAVTPRTVERLSADFDLTVRAAAAEHPYITKVSLQVLAMDFEPAVRDAALTAMADRVITEHTGVLSALGDEF